MKPTSLLLATALGLSPTLHAQILEYKFDTSSGTSSASTGSNTTALNFFTSNNTTAVNLHGPAGSGVSGRSTDFALNLTSATGMGSTGSGPVTRHTGDLNAVDALRSFTLQGWFKTDGATPIGNGARFFVNQSGGSGYQLLSNSAGNLHFQVGNGGSLQEFVSAGTAYNATQQWVFWAVTFNGNTTGTNNTQINFYVGSTTSAVSLVSSFSASIGPLLDANNNNTGTLAFGNEPSNTARGLDAWVDNIRIFGSNTDAAGALSLAQLETLRSADAIPEPSTFAAFAGVAALGFAASRRRRRA